MCDVLVLKTSNGLGFGCFRCIDLESVEPAFLTRLSEAEGKGKARLRPSTTRGERAPLLLCDAPPRATGWCRKVLAPAQNGRRCISQVGVTGHRWSLQETSVPTKQATILMENYNTQFEHRRQLFLEFLRKDAKSCG